MDKYRATGFLWVLALLSIAGLGYALGRAPLGKLLHMQSLLQGQSLYRANGAGLLEGAATGVAASLEDPYTSYLNQQDMAALETRLQAERRPGLGLELYACESGLLVCDVQDTSPAQLAGIARGDMIVSINGFAAALEEPLRPTEEGGRFILEIARNGKSRTAHITAAMIEPLPDICFAKTLHNIGYIRIRSFLQADDAQAFQAAFEDLGDIHGLVIDLRGNPGGRLESALAIAGLFIDEGLPLLYLREGDGSLTPVVAAQSKSYQLPLALLIDEQSASASEVLAGILRDITGAKLVGAQSFGKGLVQTIAAFEDGSGMRYTTSEYILPDGQALNGLGLLPDIAVDEQQNYPGWASSNGIDAPLGAAVNALAN